MAVSTSFHSVTASVPWSPALIADHPWARADAFAWGESDLLLAPACEPLLSRLVAARQPVDAAAQLVHGDLAGNILYHPELPPAVIDMSPYWRPKRYADAVIVIDAVAWAGAPKIALEAIEGPLARQLLIRALLFRFAAAGLIFVGYDERIGREAAGFARIADHLDI